MRRGGARGGEGGRGGGGGGGGGDTSPLSFGALVTYDISK